MRKRPNPFDRTPRKHSVSGYIPGLIGLAALMALAFAGAVLAAILSLL